MKGKAFLFLALSIAVALQACSEPDEVAEVHAVPCISDEMAKMMSISEVRLDMTYESLKLTGQVMENRDRLYRLYPAAGGVVSEVHVRLGERVERGDLMATVQSPDVAEFLKEKRLAESMARIAESNLRFAESLRASGVYSERDVMEAEADLEQAAGELERLREQERLLGVDPEREEPIYRIRAPESGFVLERNINAGMKLSSDFDGHLFVLADLREVWVVADVYESDIRKVREGLTARVSPYAYPDSLFSGEIVRLSSHLVQERRTMEAVITIPNDDYLLKPGMFAEIEILIEGDERLPVVPSRALIFDDNRHFVVLYRDECDVELRPVEIWTADAERTFLSSGVEAGESIISDKQLFIYNSLISD